MKGKENKDGIEKKKEKGKEKEKIMCLVWDEKV